MDYLRDLALFVELANTRSFTKAAEALGMSISSLSRRITDLEASLGVQLLSRTTRRVDLTEAGALYLARCERIVDAAREAHDHIRGLVETPQGVLRISAEAELAPLLVAPVVAEFLQLYPQVRLDLDLAPRRADLSSENFDLAIHLGELPETALTVRQLAVLNVSLYAAPAYLERHGKPAKPADLRSHIRLHPVHQGDRGEWRLTHDGESVEVEAGGSVSANSLAMIRHLARLGVGIAVLDEMVARDDVASGALVPVLPGWSLPPVAVSVLTPTRLLPAKTRRFVELMEEKMGLKPAEG
jgi:DNA-binding transcriptional LysR family regulator